MSLPINILSRSFRLIFSDPARTLKVISPGLIVSGVATYLLFGSISGADAGSSETPTSLDVPVFILALLLSILGWMCFAIFWHRYALLEGEDRDHVMRPNAEIFVQYFKGTLIVGLLSSLAALPAGLAMATVIVFTTAASPSTVALISVAIGLAFAAFLAWVLLRISLILPAAATGHTLTFSQSWRATAPVARDMLWTSVLLGVLNVVVEKIATGFATAMPEYAAFFVIAQVMIQSLIYISVLSTLYGHLIQQRPLT